MIQISFNALVAHDDCRLPSLRVLGLGGPGVMVPHNLGHQSQCSPHPDLYHVVREPMA